MWTILREERHRGRTKYLVQCDCGVIEHRRQDHVRNGRTTSCKSCASKLTAKNYPLPVKRTGCEGLSGTHYASIKYQAKRRGIALTVGPEYMWDLYVNQDGKCVYTGRKLTLVPEAKDGNPNWDVITASLDRIDSSEGYVEGNLQWVHKEINYFKNKFGHDEFLKLCWEVTNYGYTI